MKSTLKNLKYLKNRSLLYFTLNTANLTLYCPPQYSCAFGFPFISLNFSVSLFLKCYIYHGYLISLSFLLLPYIDRSAYFFLLLDPILEFKKLRLSGQSLSLSSCMLIRKIFDNNMKLCGFLNLFSMQQNLEHFSFYLKVGSLFVFLFFSASSCNFLIPFYSSLPPPLHYLSLSVCSLTRFLMPILFSLDYQKAAGFSHIHLNKCYSTVLCENFYNH